MDPFDAQLLQHFEANKLPGWERMQYKVRPARPPSAIDLGPRRAPRGRRPPPMRGWVAMRTAV